MNVCARAIFSLHSLVLCALSFLWKLRAKDFLRERRNYGMGGRILGVGVKVSQLSFSLEAFSRHDRAFGGGIVPGNFTLCGFYGNVVFLWCLLLLFFIRPLKLNEVRSQYLKIFTKSLILITNIFFNLKSK